VLGDPRRLGSDEAFVAGRSPVRVGWSAIEVRVRPGDKVGANALASLWPGYDALRLVNQAVTVKGRGRIAVSVSRAGEHIQVLVTGKIGLGRHGIVIRRAPPVTPVRGDLDARGAGPGRHRGAGHGRRVHRRGTRSLGRTPVDADLQLASATRLADTPVALLRRARRPAPPCSPCTSQPPCLCSFVGSTRTRTTSGPSACWKAAGAETYGGSANTAKGVRALREALTDLGVPSSGYLPANGSGLGHQNRVAPATMADLLHKLYFDPRVGPDCLQSLSVGGVDGTTRNRFRNSSAAERVRAKTGTLQWRVLSLGLRGRQVHVVAFSIMVRRPPSARGHQRAQRPGECRERDDALCARARSPCTGRTSHADRGSGDRRRDRRAGGRKRAAREYAGRAKSFSAWSILHLNFAPA